MNTIPESGILQVTVLTLELRSPTLPPGKRLAMDVQNASVAKDPFVIKEGVEYKSV